MGVEPRGIVLAFFREPAIALSQQMPVQELVKQIAPPPPEPVREVAAGLIYRDFLTVGLLLRKLHVQVKGSQPAALVQDNWIYVQDGGVQVVEGRTDHSNLWDVNLDMAYHEEKAT